MSVFEVAKPARNISNSEVTTFLSCKRQYRYAFIDELQPIKTEEPLARGSIFHDAMHHYWRARMGGRSHEVSMSFAHNAFINPCEPTDVTVIMKAQYLWQRYMDFHNGFPNILPLGTEVAMDLPLTPTINMSIKYDFYYQEISTGKCYILDYKLSYEFWREDDHNLNGQMPKYVAVLQANGFKVDGGKLEEIRTRDLGAEKQRDPKNLWKQTPYNPSNAKKQSMLKQHIRTSLQIEQFRNLSPEQQMEDAIPVLNKFGACKYCSFVRLCDSENEGATDLSLAKRTHYNQSTYTIQYNERPAQ